MVGDAPLPFDVCGELPRPGVTVLEASAGTGKTFTIAALTARLVAEGRVPLSGILAVTFTRMATGELRDRVRERLVSAEEGLGRLLEAGQAPPPDDEVLVLLATGDEEVVRERRRHLADALATFDAATITTTHGFCQLVLAGLGVAGTVAVGAGLLEDPRDLVEEVVDDLFVRGILRWGGLDFTRRQAVELGRQAVNNPATALEPDPDRDRSNMRARLARAVRDEVARRLLDANLLTYDDLLVRLETTLADPGRGEAACARLRDRYRVVLVDEFQDTDPVQWEVVRRAFGTRDTTLVLIGDPKQAVYAFRGADVYSYLDAARMADHRFTLDENWRSDEDLLEAYNVLLNQLHLGHPDIPYRPARATNAHRAAGLDGAPVGAALRARVLHAAEQDVQLTATRRWVQKTAAVEWVAGDVAADIVALLSSGAELIGRDSDGAERSRCRVQPGDVAVLVRTNRQAGVVQRALRAVGVPAVVAGTESVFATPAARHWLSLLEALEQPADRARAVAVALTAFVGMTAEEVADAGDGRWEQVHDRLHRWSDVLRRSGVASLFRTVTAGEGLPARVLARVDGERELTDLAHVAGLLHAEGNVGQLGPPALRAWLARRIREAGDESAEAEERSRRLDSDAAAVQVLTVHRAKGLEFPVVYCPYLWDPGWERGSGGPVVFHDPDDGYSRKLDVGGTDGPAYTRHYKIHHEEERGEDLRHLYVALTRARHQTVIHWARVQNCEDSPLGRILLFRQADGSIPSAGKFTPKDSQVHEKLLDLAQHVPGRISVERATGPGPARYEPAAASEAAPAGALRVATFDRTLDLRWRRTSYSGITAASHDEPVGSEPEDPGIRDEPAVPPPPTEAATADQEQELRAVVGPMAELPAGADFGTFVHGVLERVDFAAADVDGALAEAIRAEQIYHPLDGMPAETLAAGLRATLATPLGPLAQGATLRSISRRDRLDELSFEYPLCGGDQPTGQVPMSDVARLFAGTGETGPNLVGYSSHLADPLLGSNLRGYLNGSLDLVFRQHDAGGTPRFFVVDYKTNWLGPDGEQLSAWHYRPSALDAEMQRAHYPLQAMLYLVALHRYLRWRLPGYEPERNLAGVLYLFVRGMTGPDTPVVDGQPCGVFGWRPPAALVTGLSDLLATGSPAGSRPA
ncbi:MAG TPA: UvrD-helicase domain-containing protein [Acidimicrobiales bacterium]|nr:UvrD-helicase domain-containing protein [Acidimicrobiales bacterium]